MKKLLLSVVLLTVTFICDAASFADYSGAHINISTKNNVPDDFFQIGLNIGGSIARRESIPMSCSWRMEIALSRHSTTPL